MSVFRHEANDVALYIYGACAGTINFPILEDHWLMWPYDKQDMQRKKPYVEGEVVIKPVLEEFR